MAMQNRILGRTGVSVSPLCLGAMMFGPWGNSDEADSVRIIHRALDAGINFVDTADVYSAGESERIVGKALAGRRDDVVLATKFFMPMGTDPSERGGSRRWVIRAVENSLRRLDTDYIDLYQVHRPSQDTDVEELTQLAGQAGLTLIELAIAFVINHPAVTAAIIGPRTMEQLESQLPAAEVTLTADILDRIDQLVAPGVTINPDDNSYGEAELTPAARRRTS